MFVRVVFFFFFGGVGELGCFFLFLFFVLFGLIIVWVGWGLYCPVIVFFWFFLRFVFFFWVGELVCFFVFCIVWVDYC